MAKQLANNVREKQYTPDEAQSFMNLIITGQDAPITWAECFEILKNVPDNALAELSGGTMIEWKEGETYFFSFEGFTTSTIKNKSVKLAQLRYEDGTLGVTGAAMAINALEKVQSLPAFVKIICGGKSEGPNGDYFILNCKTFPGSTH